MFKAVLIRISFSILVFFLAVEVLLRLLAAFSTVPDGVDKTAYRILALGESTTARPFRMVSQKNWPEYLQDFARKQNFNVRVYNEGIHATTTPRIIERVPELIEKYRPHLIISMMGINDAPTFWPKEFVLEDQSIFFKSRALKLVYFLYQKAINSDSNLNDNAIPQKKIPRSAFTLDPKPIIQSFLKSKYGSQEYFNAMAEAKKMVSDRDLIQQAQYFSFLAFSIDHSSDKLDDVKKISDLLIMTAEINTSVGRSGNMALDYSIRAGFLDRCKKIIDYNKRDRAYMNDTFLKLAANCIGQSDPNYVHELFKFAGDRYTFRPEQNERPTEINYQKLKKLSLDNDICLIAMQYPNIKISDFLKTTLVQNESKIFSLEQYDSFQLLLKNNKFSDIFNDSFATDFGHTTDLGSSTIANNVLNFLLSENFNKEACHWIKK